MKKNILTAKTKKEIVDLYLENKPVKDISESLKLTEKAVLTTLLRYVSRNRLPDFKFIPPPPPTPEPYIKYVFVE